VTLNSSVKRMSSHLTLTFDSKFSKLHFKEKLANADIQVISVEFIERLKRLIRHDLGVDFLLLLRQSVEGDCEAGEDGGGHRDHEQDAVHVRLRAVLSAGVEVVFGGSFAHRAGVRSWSCD